MNNEYEFFNAPHFHDRYDAYQRELAERLVVEYVGVVAPTHSIDNAIDVDYVEVYTKSEKRIRILNKILSVIERMMNYDL